MAPRRNVRDRKGLRRVPSRCFCWAYSIPLRNDHFFFSTSATIHWAGMLVEMLFSEPVMRAN